MNNSKAAFSESVAVRTSTTKKSSNLAYLHANTEIIPLSKLKRDPKTQQRVGLNLDTVAEYKEAISLGAKFPPIKVRFDGEHYWLWDGFHTAQAYDRLKLTEIEAEVTPGNLRDAILDSVGANAEHGLRRSREDRRKAVLALLYDEEWMEWSNVKIAKYCKVSESLVRTVKKEIGFKRERVVYEDRYGNKSSMKTQTSTTKDDNTITTSFKRGGNPNKYKNNNHTEDDKKIINSYMRAYSPKNYNDNANTKVQIISNYRKGEEGIITQRANSHSAIIEFSDGSREVFSNRDFKVIEDNKLDQLINQVSQGFDRQKANFQEGDIVMVEPIERIDPRLIGYKGRYAKVISVDEYTATIKIWDKQIDSVALTDLKPLTDGFASIGVSIKLKHLSILMDNFQSLEAALIYAVRNYG